MALPPVPYLFADTSTEISSQQSSRAVRLFLDKLWSSVTKEAPEWTSATIPPYNFSKSEELATTSFPMGCDATDFLEQVVAFAIPHLSGGNYPIKAHAGWFVSILTNVLSEKDQQGILFEHTIPKIWTTLIERGSASTIGDLFNPAVLDNLREECRPAFLEKVTSLMWDNFQYRGFAGMNLILDPHASQRQHFGVYNLEDEKSQFVQQLANKIGIPQFVTATHSGNTLVPKIHFLIDCFDRLPPEQAHELAEEMDRQIGRDQIISEIQIIMEGRTYQIPAPWAGTKLFTRLIHNLPEHQKTEYSDFLMSRLGPNAIDILAGQISWMGFNTIPHEFIDALPPHVAVPLVTSLVQRALTADYHAKDGDYGDGINCYNERINFATALHSIIPTQYQSIYEATVIEFLESASTGNAEALLKASLLLRAPLTKEGQLQTREIDFYPIRNQTTDALAHIKPGQNRESSVLTSGQFIGSLADFEDRSTKKESLGAPRWLPPHQRELFPRERYAPLLPDLQIAEQESHADVSSGLPTLLEVLRARQPMPLLADVSRETSLPQLTGPALIM